MKHKWILRLEGEKRIPEKLSDYLGGATASYGETTYKWEKVENSDATINYVCFLEGKQVGFIPLDWDDNDVEMDTYWSAAKARGLETLKDIMYDIMDRHSEKNK